MKKGSLPWLYTALLIAILLAINDVSSAENSTVATTTSDVAGAHTTPHAHNTSHASNVVTTSPSSTAAVPTPSLTRSPGTTQAIIFVTTSPNSTVAVPTPSLTRSPGTTQAIISVTTLTSTPVAVPIPSPTTNAPSTSQVAIMPSKGPNISHIETSSHEFKVTWNKLSDDQSNGKIIKYQVCYQEGSNVAPPNCSTHKNETGTNNTMTNLTELDAATTYSVAVRAVNKVGEGPFGNTFTARTNESVPSKGPDINRITTSSDEIQVTWNKLDDDDSNGKIIKYQVCYQEGSNVVPLTCTTHKNETGSNNMTNLTGLDAATPYMVAVRAFTKIGHGGFGNTSTVMTNESVPSKGPDIDRITTSSNKLQVTWNKLNDDDSNGKIIKYQVCYQEGSNVVPPTCSTHKNETGSKNMTNLTGLDAATPYSVAIRAFTKIGHGGFGNTSTIMTNESEPSTGPNISRIVTSSNELKIIWNKLSDDDANGKIIKYQVCYEESLIVEPPTCTTDKNETSSNITMTNITGLDAATSYSVAVRAFTKIGPGPFGLTWIVATNDSNPTRGPNVTRVHDVTSTSMNITWNMLSMGDSNGKIIQYRVCYKASDKLSNITLSDCIFNQDVFGADNTTTVLSNLNEATTYIIAVKARTKAGFGSLGPAISNTTLEDKPVNGPNVTGATAAEGSKSLVVTWGTLDPNDANGIITHYAVCYKPVGKSENICKSNDTIMADARTIILNDLEIFTSYVIAVRASTEKGFGPVGRTWTAKTNEDKPSNPIIETRSIITKLTTISLKWSEPNQPNGIILNYQVCWKPTDGEADCKNQTDAPSSLYRINLLRPGTQYDVVVSAFTSVGKGTPAKTTQKTIESSLDGKKFSESKGISVDKTEIEFQLPDLDTDEVKEIKHFYVIVKRWTDKENKEQLRDISTDKLETFENSTGGEKAYVAVTKNEYLNGMKITVGNNRPQTGRRKRRIANTYQNAPLSENTRYAIFIRVFYDENKVSFQSSDILIITTEKEDGDSSVALIVIVIVVVIVAVLVIIFGVLLLRRRKARPDYNGIHLEPTTKPVVRYPIPIGEFRAHCERLGMNTGLGYQEEYESIRPYGTVTAEIAKRQENVDKNRYNNIHAYDDTRVILSQLDGEEGSDYINANHIDGFEHKNQFIASQGALKHTVVDFWRMIWEQNVSSIVMLANPIEKGREKLAVYWPQDRAVKHGPFMIKLDGEVELADYVIRKMTVTKDDIKETRQLTQFHYTVWPDHGVPLYTTSLQAFLTRIRKFVKDDSSNPCIVHCSAGVGRTGTFIGIFAMLDMIEKNKTVDIFNFVCQMRTQRTHMVQVESQYVFLHKAVLEAIECGDTEINAPDLRVKMIQFNRAAPDNPDETIMEKQFKVLEKYTFIKSNTEEGKKPFNVDKNRDKDILPYEDTRVSLLKSPGVDGSDYINASSIDSYQVRGMYIATQFPLENTMNDFWRMIWEKKSNCVVMLANVEEDPELYKKYWTDKTNDALLCGNFLVTLENEEKNDEFVTRIFKLKKNEGGETREIWHFNFLSWTKDKVPVKTVGIRQMIGKMQDVQRQGGNNPIVVHCSDGSGRTGAFCALVTSLERVKQDQSFNLFQTIMLQRIQRPRMVTSVDQYKFCFQAILDFLDSFDQYANFQDLRQ